MKIRMMAVAAILSMASPAFADQLDDGAAICAKYKTHPGAITPRIMAQAVPEYAPGWEHCSAIAAAKKSRGDAASAGDEARNPELKATRALAKTLGK